ncbi:hypothetical protein [Alkaliphilus metalliredigens]|uniref:hypothetical protein n=1 Tax=Alkaliphilus metalliredigens TaxID=208226 RepID=UPI00059F8396|nr:hypothetical protein [Alkaliphilus metalliredigens]
MERFGNYYGKLFAKISPKTLASYIWETIAFTIIFIVGIIMIFKPNYLINARSNPGYSKVLGVLFLILSITRVGSVWHL